MVKGILGGILSILLVVAAFSLPLLATTDKAEQLKTNLSSFTPLEAVSAKAPTVAKPDWYNQRTITYSVTTNGTVKGSLAEFKTQSNETLNDPKGWAQMDVRFVEVASGGEFTLVLAQASRVPSYSPSGCSADWSCAVGRNVIINDDRWMGATTAWNNAGGGLRDYRHMVVNHEVGHWLGHDHAYCGGAGQSAPVMQQQSMGLQGCTFNPWPAKSELWSSRI